MASFLGRHIYWRDPAPETRALEQITYSDIGVAFAEKQKALLGARAGTALPAVYRAVQLISDIGASLPMEQIGRDGIAAPLTPELLSRPDPTATYSTTLRKILSSLLLRGNAYLWPRMRDEAGNIRSIYVLNPDEVSVAWDSNRLYPEYSWRDRKMEPGTEILHIPINLWPGMVKGVGPIEACRLMLEGAHAEADMSREIFTDDATPTGLLSVPRALNKEEAEKVQQSWIDSHGADKRPAVLSGGVTFEALTINPVDAQWIEQRNFSVQEIGRMFGLDGFFLLVDSGGSLTYSTTEQLLRLFLIMTLNPTYLEPISQTFSLMLPEPEVARFNTNEILVADIKSRYEAYEIGIRNEFLEPDEVRRLEGRPPFDTATRDRMARRPAPIAAEEEI